MARHALYSILKSDATIIKHFFHKKIFFFAPLYPPRKKALIEGDFNPDLFIEKFMALCLSNKSLLGNNRKTGNKGTFISNT